MIRDAAKKEWDVVVFWALDRFTPEGTLETVKNLVLLESRGIHWRSCTEPWIDSANPHCSANISMLASLAKQEQVRIQERARAGLRSARIFGTMSGRPVGRPKAVFDKAKAVELRRAGLSWGKIARQLGTSVASVRRACKSLSEPEQLRRQVSTRDPCQANSAADGSTISLEED
jgi:DNA invertase Pin-like site-specific DNA recombinase